LRLQQRALNPSDLSHMFLDQSYVGEAGALIVIASAIDRIMARYGERGYRYALLEAGHVAQNASLIAVALGVGALNLGGFLDESVSGLLNTTMYEVTPLYAVALGVPVPGDRSVREIN